MRTSAGDLLERDAELRALDDALDAAAAASGGLVVVAGEAGAGKTSLVTAAVRRAVDRGFAVLLARAAELETDLALGALRRLLDPGANAAVTLSEAMRRAVADGPEGLDRHYGLAHRLTGELADVAEQTPVLVCLDDAQWADPASLRALAYLASRTAGQRLLVLLGVRTGDSEDPVLHALLQPPATVLTPARLSLDAAGALLTATTGAEVAATVVEHCHRASGGNPFFLVALARALAEDPTSTSLPTSVTGFVRSRLARRTPAARSAAHALAVLGDGAPLHHVADLAGLDPDTVLAAGAELTRAGILDAGRALTFAHPLIETAVRSEVEPHERARAHQRAADLLVADGAAADAVAAHLLHTAPAGRDDTVDLLARAAADAVARGAAATAVPLLLRAWAEPPAAHRRSEVLVALGTAEMEAGVPDSVPHLQQGVALATRPEDVVHGSVVLAGATALTAGIEAAVDVLDAARSRVPAEQAALHTDLDAHTTQLCLFDAHLYARGFGRLREIAEPAGKTPAERALLAQLACGEVFFGGTAAEAARLVRLALADGQLAQDPGFDAIPFGLAVFAAGVAGEVALAAAELAAARRRTEQRGAVGDQAVLSVAQAILDHRRGDLRALEESLVIGRLALAAAGPHLGPTLAPAYGVKEALVRAESGDAAGADAALRAADMDGDVRHDPNRHRLLGYRARALLALDRYDAVLADAESLREHQRDVGMTWDASSPWRVWAALSLAALGDHRQAAELADAELTLAGHWGAPHELGLALRARGAAEPEPAAAAVWFERAVAAHEHSADPLELARARYDLGRALHASGRTEQARAPLEDAMDGAAQVGATRLCGLARTALVSTGARPRRVRTTGLDGLTAAERRVAAMAVEGLTNREIAQRLFVTVKTVEGHLRQVYAKLDVAGRAGLRAAWPSAG